MKLMWFVWAMILVFIVVPAYAGSQTAGTAAIAPPVIREGALAVKLATVLNSGIVSNEITSESVLSSEGVAPRNGWIADYPVTPDIAGEVKKSLAEAADNNMLNIAKDEALAAFDSLMKDYGLNEESGGSDQTVAQEGPAYTDSTGLEDYYVDQGPPVVTYYMPPPDYEYLYTWVPYPFWWAELWFPGYYVLNDFDYVGFADRGHHHDGDHDFRRGRDWREGGKHVSNHFAGSDGSISRVDPANRSFNRTFVSGSIAGSHAPGAPTMVRGGNKGLTPTMSPMRNALPVPVQPRIVPGPQRSYVPPRDYSGQNGHYNGGSGVFDQRSFGYRSSGPFVSSGLRAAVPPFRPQMRPNMSLGSGSPFSRPSTARGFSPSFGRSAGAGHMGGRAWR